MFKNKFEQLNEEYQFVIFSTLQRMEHKRDKSDKIDIKRGLDVAREELDLTEDKLGEMIADKLHTKWEYIKNSYVSMVKRNSINSSLYKPTLEVLGIDEDFLFTHSYYFNERESDFQWLYESLLPRDKDAICYVVLQLLDISYIASLLETLKKTDTGKQNFGIETFENA